MQAMVGHAELILESNKGFAFMLYGTPLLTSPHIPQYAKKKVEVPRTWRERLFSRPWRPWVKTKQIEVDDTDTPIILKTGWNFLCHPANVDRIKKEVAEAFTATVV